MRVVRAKKMGFCHGVRKSFDTVMRLGRELQFGESGKGGQIREIVMLGDIVHNKDVVERVEQVGIRTIRSIDNIKGKTVVLRTHGEARGAVEELVKARNELVDCTCAIVKEVRKKALLLEKRHPAVVIVGMRNHPEIVGLVSWLANPHIMMSEEDIEALPHYRSVGVVSQTTISAERYESCIELLEDKYGKWDEVAGTGAEWLQTICGHTRSNQASSVEVAGDVDVMIVVGSRNSSNSTKLYEKCLEVNPNALFVRRLAELDLSAFNPAMSVGITSGASTPDWIVEEIVRALESV